MDWLSRIRLELLAELETYTAGMDVQVDNADSGISIPVKETQDGKSRVSNHGAHGTTSSLRGLLLPETIRNMQWGWWFVIAFLVGALTAHAWASRYNLEQAK